MGDEGIARLKGERCFGRIVRVMIIRLEVPSRMSVMHCKVSGMQLVSSYRPTVGLRTFFLSNEGSTRTPFCRPTSRSVGEDRDFS